MRPGSTLWSLLSLSASFIFLWLAFHRISWPAVRETLSTGHLLPWLPLGIALYCTGHFIRGHRCRLLVSQEARLRTTTATSIVVVGYAVNNVLPLRLGELARAGMLTRRTGLPMTQSLTVTFTERLFDGIVLLLMLLATGMLLPLEGWIRPAMLVSGVILGVATAAVGILIASPHGVTHLVARLTGRLGGRMQTLCLHLLAHTLSGVAYLRKPAAAARVFGITMVIWLFDAALFWTILGVFDLPLHPGWALLAMAVTNIGILVPSAPGHIGPFHFFAMQALISVGVAETTAAGYALVVHLAIFVPLTLWGAGLLWRQGLQVGATIAAVRAARTVGTVPANEPGTIVAGSTYREAPPVTTPFMRSLAEAFTPRDQQPGGPEARQQAVDRAAEFLTGQLRELPPGLRGAFRTGCWGFRLLVCLQHGRGFVSLPLARRQALVEAWAYGPVAPARQLFRPVRSLVLLAWYDPPAQAAQEHITS